MADYDINAVTRRVVYDGSSGLGPYAFSFEILATDDITVYFNASVLTITTDYTVTINANGTGSVNIVTGGVVPSTPVAADQITIVGARDIERTTDFVTAGDLRASALNEQLDGQIIMIQQVAEENARGMRAPVFDPALVEDGGVLDMTLPTKADRVGKYLAFDANGNPTSGPSTENVNTLASITDDIALLADIEDGTDATDAIQTVAGISSNVTSVANISSNVSTVAGISSDVTAVAGDASDIGTVSTNIANVNTVAGISSNVTTVATNNSNVTAVAGNATNINSVASVSSDVTTVAGISSDVTTVAADGTDIGTVAGVSANVTTVASISGNVTTVAGVSANVTTVAGISADVTTVAGDSADIQAVAADATDIGTVATNIANVNAVGGDIANVNTVATNIADVNSFANTYFVSASAPSSPTEGDLWFDTTNDIMKVYDGAGFVNAGSSVNGTANRVVYTATAGQTTFNATYDAGYVDVYLNGVKLIVTTDFTATNGSTVVLATGATLNDTVDIVAYGTFSLAVIDIVNDDSPQLGGNLDLNSFSITGTGSIPAANLTGTLPAIDGSALTGISTDLVGDTTPQLGGDLDLNSNDITGTGAIPAANLTGILPAIDGSALTGIGADLVDDTTPQLGGNLDLNNFDITGTGDIDITGGLTTTGSVGIGTSTPDYLAEVEGSGGGNAVTLAVTNTGSNPSRLQLNSGHGNWSVANSVTVADNLEFRDESANATRMRIDSNGTVRVTTEGGAGLFAMQQGLCKQWINFTGIGALIIRDSFNTSSISDNGTGNYTVFIASNMANSDWSAFLQADLNNNAGGIYTNNPDIHSVNTGQYGIGTYNNSNFADLAYIRSGVFGDLS